MIAWLLEQEERNGAEYDAPISRFRGARIPAAYDLVRLLQTLAADGKRVIGYGASTKGQCCTAILWRNQGMTWPRSPESNSDHFRCIYPRYHIPIISEAEARDMKPDYFLVLPWHFKEGILQREAEFLAGGGRMIFPSPEIEIV